MSDLVTFLLDRIADDEAVARAILAQDFSEGRWVWTSHNPAPYRSALMNDRGAVVLPSKNDDVYPSAAVAAHIARHDPARVLVECETKRRIIEWHKNWPVLVESAPSIEPADPADVNTMTFRMSQQIAWMTEREYVARFGTDPPTSPILRLLALPYADHEAYREEWRP